VTRARRKSSYDQFRYQPELSFFLVKLEKWSKEDRLMLVNGGGECQPMPFGGMMGVMKKGKCKRKREKGNSKDREKVHAEVFIMGTKK
jgi:hypothetical protein